MKRTIHNSFLWRHFLCIAVLGIICAVVQPAYSQSSGGTLRVAARPSAPLFSGRQGKQRTEIHFDPTTHIVTLKMLVQDQNGYLIPNLHSDNFAVYENGVRQQATVNVEHAPVILMILMEHGGRTPALDRLLDMDISAAAGQLVELLGRNDRVQVSTYSDDIHRLVDCTNDTSKAEGAIDSMSPPESSEVNLYDTIMTAVKQMNPIQGRKAIILISTGVNTFSKASFDDALKTVQASDTPIYVISMAKTFHELTQLEEPSGPAARLNWRIAENQLEEIGRESGGRTYSPEDSTNLSAIYDDMFENLRVRYVITYRSSNNEPLDVPRRIRIELVDPQTGAPLRIIDSHGHTVPFNLVFQGSYTPAKIAGLRTAQP